MTLSEAILACGFRALRFGCPDRGGVKLMGDRSGAVSPLASQLVEVRRRRRRAVSSRLVRFRCQYFRRLDVAKGEQEERAEDNGKRESWDE